MKIQDRDTISKPGQYKLDSLVLLSYNGAQFDLRPNMLELVLHEDIYANCLSGQVMIAENVNLIKNIPIIGNEFIQIVFKTPSRDSEISKTFFVYKVDNKVELHESSRANIYTLHFVSDEFMKSQTNKISRSYNNMTYGKMVESLYRDYLSNSTDLKICYVQETSGSKSLVIPYMTPLQAINWLCTKAISSNVKDYAYLFYETMDGFFFSTINYSVNLSRTPRAKYAYFTSGMTVPAGFADINRDFKRIEKFQILTFNNTVRHVNDGVLSSRLLTHDIVYKTFEYNDFAYNFDYVQMNTINEYGILPQTADRYSAKPFSNYQFYPKHSYLYDGNKNNDDYENVVLKRNAHLSHYETSRMEIVVAGDSNRRVGDLVDVKIFSGEPSNKNNSDVYDPYLSGLYLVTKITHVVQPQEYKMRLELGRDSIPEPYPDVTVDKS